MTFPEKSAWGLLTGLLGISWFYFPAAFAVASRPEAAVGLVVLIAVAVVFLVIFEVIYHTVIAVSAPREANLRDERDRVIDLRAERNASFALGASLFILIWHVLANAAQDVDRTPGALTIVVWIMLAITASEVVKLASQIWAYRFGA